MTAEFKANRRREFKKRRSRSLTLMRLQFLPHSADLRLNTLFITTDNNNQSINNTLNDSKSLWLSCVCQTCWSMLMNTRAGLRLLPLTVSRHVDGPSHRDWRPALRHRQHLHRLPLRSPFAVTTQHGRVHALPGRVCWAVGRVRTGVKGQRQRGKKVRNQRKVRGLRKCLFLILTLISSVRTQRGWCNTSIWCCNK